MNRHTISVLTNDHPGVLQRVAGLFSRRNFNIESITVGSSEQEHLSRMTIVAAGDHRVRDQLIYHLGKLIDVMEVLPLDLKHMVSRELMLVKVKAEPEQRKEIIDLSETFGCSVCDVGHRSLILQIIGETSQNNALLQLLKRYGIIEATRTGETSMKRT